MNSKAKSETASHIVGAVGTAPPNILHVDTARFAHHLESWDASEDEKAEYLTLIWRIVVQFVDIGYGIHPLSSATQESCGQASEKTGHGAAAPENGLESRGKRSIEEIYNAAGKRPAEREKS